MKTITETYALDGMNTAAIPAPHDFAILDIREEDGCLVIVFEDDISSHDAAQAHPDARTLTVRFHLVDGGLNGIYRYRRTKHHEGYMRVKSLRKLLEGSKRSAAYLYHYVAYHQVIVELCADDMMLLMLEADSAEFVWTLNEGDDPEGKADGRAEEHPA